MSASKRPQSVLGALVQQRKVELARAQARPRSPPDSQLGERSSTFGVRGAGRPASDTGHQRSEPAVGKEGMGGWGGKPRGGGGAGYAGAVKANRRHAPPRRFQAGD